MRRHQYKRVGRETRYEDHQKPTASYARYGFSCVDKNVHTVVLALEDSTGGYDMQDAQRLKRDVTSTGSR